MEFFATCPSGFEQILAHELSELGIPRVRPLQGQVSFDGEPSDAYRACLWSHLASRVIVVLARGGATTSDELYDTVAGVPWEEHIAPSSSFAISASGTNARLRTTQFISLRAKDAIADRMTSHVGTRPSVNAKSPDVSVMVRVNRDRATIGIDLAGAPLFSRGYERAGGQRGLRPDHAAAMLHMAGWPEICAKGGASLLDLTSGTTIIPVEAALIAARRAPGLLRLRWGFTGWAKHDANLWQSLTAEARELSLDHCPAGLSVSASAKTASAVRRALRAAGLEPALASVDVRAQAAQETKAEPSLLVCDLAYLATDDLVRETSELSMLARTVTNLHPARIGVAGRDQLAGAYLAQKPCAEIKSILGKDALLMDVFDGTANRQALPEVEVAAGTRIPVLVSSTDQFAARLRKVARLRAKWAKRTDVSCYRLYDADLPDYAVALDLYQGCDPETGMPNDMRWLQVAEYAAPKGIDETTARARLMDVLTVAPAILGVDSRNTFLRVRRRDKGGSQYADEARQPVTPSPRRPKGDAPLPPGAHLIDEGGLTFEVNFSSRLDCGIFLDHRETRSMLREMAKDTSGSKRFLNLFAYTGTATCYAADGGMRYTTTVDLSRPSLDWAKRNMERNGFSGKEHEYVQADVVRWVGEQRHTRNRWDLIFCDVPTFSNSSRMGKRSFDVQRDHAELLIGVSRLLMRGGTCVFSCNLRSFKPDVEKLAKAGVTIEDITAQTIPEDFARNPRIHHAYIVRRP